VSVVVLSKRRHSEDHVLVGYSDSDWAGDVDSRKSINGLIFF
jgi:hypothetical protein